MNGRNKRNAPITRTASPANLSTVQATTTPATAKASPRSARATRARSMDGGTVRALKGYCGRRRLDNKRQSFLSRPLKWAGVAESRRGRRRADSRRAPGRRGDGPRPDGPRGAPGRHRAHHARPGRRRYVRGARVRQAGPRGPDARRVRARGGADAVRRPPDPGGRDPPPRPPDRVVAASRPPEGAVARGDAAAVRPETARAHDRTRRAAPPPRPPPRRPVAPRHPGPPPF